MNTFLLILGICGAFICVVNFYTSWLAYPVHKFIFKRTEKFQFSSGFPLLGSLFIVLSLTFYQYSMFVFWAGVTLALLDTGGVHWFVGTLIYQKLIKLNA
jgi:hypothetical protein